VSEEYARTPDIPTLYLSERGPRGWTGVGMRCGHCRPAGLLTVLDDRLSCLQCGRDAAKVLENRPKPVPKIDWGKNGYRAPLGAEKGDGCIDCGGERSRYSVARCQPCHRAASKGVPA